MEEEAMVGWWREEEDCIRKRVGIGVRSVEKGAYAGPA